MSDKLFDGRTRLKIRALLVAEGIDTRALAQQRPRLGLVPLVLKAGRSGVAVLFGYGAVVFFDVAEEEVPAFLGDIAPHLVQPFAKPESEEAEILIDPAKAERVSESGLIALHEPSIDRLQAVADVLAKSLILAFYEAGIADTFARVEPVARDLALRQAAGAPSKALLKEIGGVLLMQHKMIGRAEVVEKPDILWDHPQIGHLYSRLRAEYELPERHLALDRKLDLIAKTAETILALAHRKASLRLEWLIVILFVADILLVLAEMAW